MCWHTEHVFAATVYAPRQARCFAVAELVRAPDVPGARAAEFVTGDVALIVSELVTNAVQAGSDTIVVSMALHRVTLWVAVTDRAPGWPVVQQPSMTGSHGRGLILVEELTTQWGVSRVSGGKKAWAVLPVPERLTAALGCAREGASRGAS